MKYNQYSYLSVDQKDILKELKEIGFDLPLHLTEKELFEWFVRKVYFTYKNTDYPLSNLVADAETDLLSYFQSDREWSPEIFYTVALQLLGFRYFIDFEDTDSFLKEVQFPIEYGNLVENLYHLLNTRTVKGNLLIEQLVSDGLIPEDNRYHFFNGKSLATFNCHDVIREVVYVESRIDSDQDGLPDLIKVNIIRPRYEGKIPAVMTASPYHQGTNDKASDKALYNMNVDLEKKKQEASKSVNPRSKPLTQLEKPDWSLRLKKPSLISTAVILSMTTFSPVASPISTSLEWGQKIHKG